METFKLFAIIFTAAQTISARSLAEMPATVIAPPNAESSGCDLAVPGIDKDLFQIFFEKLKAAAAEKNADALAPLVFYPLSVNSEPRKKIRNAGELKQNFSTIFTKRPSHQSLNRELKISFVVIRV